MPIKLEIVQETPNEVVNAILAFAGHFKTQGAVVTEPALVPATEGGPGETAQVAEPGKKPGRRKAPAADVVIDQVAKTATELSKEGITIEQARERMKKFAADGHMDAVEKALAHYNVKRVSDVDPDAKGEPSAKFAEFVAKIEEYVGAAS